MILNNEWFIYKHIFVKLVSKTFIHFLLLLQTTCANCISAAADHIFVGCSNGVVRVFNAKTLHFVTTLPRPHHLGVDVAAAVNTR